MSNSALSLIPFGPDSGCSIDSRTIDYYFYVPVTAGNYVQGGIPMSWAGSVQAPGAPLFVWLESQNSPNSGFVYAYNPGAALASSSARLGFAASYALLAYSGITGSGSDTVTGGNIGTVTASITAPPSLVPPAVVDNTDAVAAEAAANVAYSYYAGLPVTATLTTANIATQGNGSGVNVYIPGVYKSASSLACSTATTLDAQGNPNAVFVFIATTTFTFSSSGTFILANGAVAANVIVIMGTSLTVSNATTITGNYLAQASASLAAATTVNGRLLVGLNGSAGAITFAAATSVFVAAASAIATAATQTSGKLQILTGAAAQSPLTELSAGATPAGVVSDTIVCIARFLRG